MTGAGHQHEPPSAPWVLVDDLTIDQAAGLLERLTSWLTGPDTSAAARCARALSSARPMTRSASPPGPTPSQHGYGSEPQTASYKHGYINQQHHHTQKT